jgi:benzoyl-CoA reductase/2-hydroxyglutaryl-CoA dehydratase subunit BcrC/BadD/HgdB
MAPLLDRDHVYSRFHDAVNMAPAELEEWLESEQSRTVGFMCTGASESIGHASGRRVVSILGKRKAELDDDDYAHMRKVVGFIRRHSAQRPENTVTSRWRYSLMNWGHDPIKEG